MGSPTAKTMDPGGLVGNYTTNRETKNPNPAYSVKIDLKISANIELRLGVCSPAAESDLAGHAVDGSSTLVIAAGVLRFQ